MNSTALDTALDVWQPDGCAVRIEYSRAVMEELRLAAFDGLNRLAHGGVEIGGVLFGVRDPDAVKVLAYRALACEYAFGPTFTLWDNDRRALEKVLVLPNTDSNLSGMQPVGWYHSHTRSEIQLSEKDLQLYQQYFPETWQIALVLRPRRFDPVRAGFFFREPDGSVHSASSRQEFIVKPVGGKPGMRLPGDGLPADTTMADTAPAPANPALIGAPTVREGLPFPEPALLEPQPEPAAGAGNPRSELEPRPSQLPAVYRNPCSELEPRPPQLPAPRAASGNSRRRWVPSVTMSGAAIAMALGGVLFWIAWSRASAGLSLRALDVGGQLRIDWNRNSRVIQQSQSGALEIEDGSRKVHDELSQEHLRAGNITYLRTTGNVLVRLLVRGADRSTFTEISRFLGPPVAAAAPATAAPATAALATAALATAAPTTVALATAAPIDAGSADRSAKKDATGAAPPRWEPEQEVQHGEPVKQPSNWTSPEVVVNSESARQTPAASAPVRRRLVLPSAGVPRPDEHFLPAPPTIATDIAAAMAAFPQDPNHTGIPRLLALVPLNPVDQGPAAGKIIWTGKLSRSATIQIFGNRASQGQITGGLPGAPVRVQVFPSELTPDGLRIFTADPRSIGASEAPGAQNGWNRTVYVLNPRKAGEIGILEAPGRQNAWNRLILRAERGDHSIIVLRWERVPAESAPGADNQ